MAFAGDDVSKIIEGSCEVYLRAYTAGAWTSPVSVGIVEDGVKWTAKAKTVKDAQGRDRVYAYDLTVEGKLLQTSADTGDEYESLKALVGEAVDAVIKHGIQDEYWQFANFAMTGDLEVAFSNDTPRVLSFKLTKKVAVDGLPSASAAFPTFS